MAIFEGVFKFLLKYSYILLPNLTRNEHLCSKISSLGKQVLSRVEFWQKTQINLTQRYSENFNFFRVILFRVELCIGLNWTHVTLYIYDKLCVCVYWGVAGGGVTVKLGLYTLYNPPLPPFWLQHQQQCAFLRSRRNQTNETKFSTFFSLSLPYFEYPLN